MTLYKRKPEIIEALKISDDLEPTNPFFDNVEPGTQDIIHQAKHFRNGYIVKWPDGTCALWDTAKFEAEYEPVV